jgi:hypothetical protein
LTDTLQRKLGVEIRPEINEKEVKNLMRIFALFDKLVDKQSMPK